MSSRVLSSLTDFLHLIFFSKSDSGYSMCKTFESLPMTSSLSKPLNLFVCLFVLQRIINLSVLTHESFSKITFHHLQLPGLNIISFSCPLLLPSGEPTPHNWIIPPLHHPQFPLCCTTDFLPLSPFKTCPLLQVCPFPSVSPSLLHPPSFPAPSQCFLCLPCPAGFTSCPG